MEQNELIVSPLDFVIENLSILNNKISITKTRISFENFITIWNFLEEIPLDQIQQIQNLELTIDTNNIDFLNFLDAIANSSISFDCTFIFLSQSSENALIEFQKIWLKMNFLSNKQRIQTNLRISQRSLLNIIPDKFNELCAMHDRIFHLNFVFSERNFPNNFDDKNISCLQRQRI